MSVNNIAEKLIADTIAAEVYISSVVVVESRDTLLPEDTLRETIISSGGEQGPAGVSEEDMVYARRIDFTTNDTIIYKGEATVGSLESSAVWRIRRITIAGDNDTSEQWADGDSLFNNIWDNRVGLAYS